jgi:hypothetical protein
LDQYDWAETVAVKLGVFTRWQIESEIVLVALINDNDPSARARLVGFTQDCFPQLDELKPK